MNTDYSEQARQSADIEYEIEAGNYEKATALIESGYSMLFVLLHEPYWAPTRQAMSFTQAVMIIASIKLKHTLKHTD